jgi:signal transduction histidine kinase
VERWLALFIAGRLTATGIAAALLIWSGLSGLDALLLTYGPISTALLAGIPRLRASRAAWAVDFAATLTFVIVSGDWRSPFYLMWLSALALPAVSLPFRDAVWVAAGATVAYLAVAVLGGPVPGRLQLVSSETLAIHLSLPFLLVCALAYAADALRRLGEERTLRERLAIEAERKRIAWDLHDSAKQRIHAAHLLVSSLGGRVGDAAEHIVARATVELESASADMDTSLAELRSPLEGRPLEEALHMRCEELVNDGTPRVSVSGRAPELPPLVAAHAYRIGCEALTNALRHAGATAIHIALDGGGDRLTLSVSDDGRGLPEERRPGASGLFAMESRATTIGGRLVVGAGPSGRGTQVLLEVPLTHQEGAP